MALHDSEQNISMTINSLPAAAQRWINSALPKSSTNPSTIVIEQDGSMDIRGRWTDFTARGIYEMNPFSFKWRAKLHMMRGVWIVAEDGHENGKGWGGARLWGVVPMGKRTDPQVLKSQLVRNLGELAWMPGHVINNPALTFADVGENIFEISTTIADVIAIARFEIDDQGDVVKASSPARPYDVPDGYEEAPWHYEFSDHREFNGVRIPAAAVARFEKPDGIWEYFRCKIISTTSGTN